MENKKSSMGMGGVLILAIALVSVFALASNVFTVSQTTRRDTEIERYRASDMAFGIFATVEARSYADGKAAQATVEAGAQARAQVSAMATAQVVAESAPFRESMDRVGDGVTIALLASLTLASGACIVVFLMRKRT